MFSLKKLIILFLVCLVLVYIYFIISKKENFAIEENNILSLRSHIDCSNENANQQGFGLKRIINNELSNRNIEYIMDATFMLFRNLEDINLVNKSIKVLHKETFMNNKNLKHINLEGTKINTIVSDMLKNNMNIKLNSFERDNQNQESNGQNNETTSAIETTSADDKYSLHFESNFQDNEYLSNKINLVLTKNTLYRLNILKTADEYSIMRHFSHLPYDRINDNSVNIYNFIKYINGLANDDNGNRISIEVFNRFIKILLGISANNLENFNLTIGNNNGSSQKYPINVVYYKDIIYHTDCGHWRKQFMNSTEVSSDAVLNTICLMESVDGNTVYTHILDIFKSLHLNLLALSFINGGLNAYLSGNLANFSDGESTATEIIAQINLQREKLDQFTNSSSRMQSNNQYKNLFIEFFSQRFGRGCLSINSLGSRVQDELNQVEQVNYQCNSLVQDILADARSEVQSSAQQTEESVPENRLNFCNMISNYDTCTDLEQCETYVSNDDTSRFICRDVCENMNINNCEVFDNCIFRNNKCISKSILELNDDEIGQYHVETTYPSNVTFSATPTEAVIDYPYDTTPLPSTDLEYPFTSDSVFSYASTEDIPKEPDLTEQFQSISTHQTMIVKVGNDNYQINYCGDVNYNLHGFYDLYHLNENERFHRLALILKNIFNVNNGMNRYEELLDEASSFLINNSRSMIATINSA